MLRRFFSRRPKTEEIQEEPAPPREMLDLPLLQFGSGNRPADSFTLRDAVQGTIVFGGIGSGKTSGSGQSLAAQFLQLGFGGIVLCAKAEEVRLWQGYARKTGRADDLIVFSSDGGQRFNFLDYEMTRPGRGAGQAETIVRLFWKAVEYNRRGAPSSSDDPTWDNLARQMIRNAVDVLIPSGERVGLDEINEIIMSAPHSAEEVGSPQWKADSFLWRCILAAEGKNKAGQMRGRLRDFDKAVEYWTGEFATMPPKQRGSVISIFTSMAEPLNRGMLYELLCTDSTFGPEDTLDGKIIILDLNLKEFGHVGLVAQNIFKYLWQGAMERRNVETSPLPVFMWGDESQYFINEDDALFQQTARGSRVCSVFLTQNISNYYHTLGEGKRSTVDSLLGNFQTKIFHSNGDSVTNNWAAETIAKSFKVIEGRGLSIGDNGPTVTTNENEQLHFEIQPQQFQALRSGGPLNGLEVDAYIFKPDKQWSATGRNWRPVTFLQNILEASA